jgi:hypothetical protein
MYLVAKHREWGNGGTKLAKLDSNSPGRVSVDELIRLNQDLLAVAEHARRTSRELVHRSSMDRIQRCLTGVYRDPAWALGMAQWVAGIRLHPPRGVRTRDLP